MQDGVANTAFTHHSYRTYALHEGSLPFEIKVDKNLEIEYLGYSDFGGWLQDPMSAHPRIDR